MARSLSLAVLRPPRMRKIVDGAKGILQRDLRSTEEEADLAIQRQSVMNSAMPPHRIAKLAIIRRYAPRSPDFRSFRTAYQSSSTISCGSAARTASPCAIGTGRRSFRSSWSSRGAACGLGASGGP